MKKIVLILVFCGIFFSFCRKDENLTNENLVIEVLDNEIISRDDINDKNIRNVTRFQNYLIDSTCVNKINVKITNKGLDKYVFFIGKNLDNYENYRPENISLRILKENENVDSDKLGVSADCLINGIYSRLDLNQIERFELKEELNEIYLKEKISFNKIDFHENMNFVVIHPGESKFFSYYKTLPVYIEDTSIRYYKFNRNEKYYFQISLQINSEVSKKYFTTNQFNEIKTNGYTIFDGTINSNKVPIKFVNMNKK